MKFLAALVLATISFGALADQCAYNTITDAISAKGLLTNKDVIFWCQNCSQKPSNIKRARSATVARKNGTNEVTVTLSDGKKEAIDLAYVYVRTATDIFANVSHLVGCESTGAMTFVKTGPGTRKEAHFYNDHGSRVVGTKALDEDISGPWASTMETDKTRVPANTK
ncbi:MAG: hypothetical protein ACJ76H_02335 [Bacteriovoracaceae bacterium]